MSRTAVFALALWAITVPAAVYLFFSGYTTKGSDGRDVVLVTSVERVQILEEMRGLLQATADITGALSRDDNVAIARIAKQWRGSLQRYSRNSHSLLKKAASKCTWGLTS